LIEPLKKNEHYTTSATQTKQTESNIKNWCY
jgi:hypothetical protein